jgi:hypothetical protein
MTTPPLPRPQFYGRMFPPTNFRVDKSKEVDLHALGQAMKDRAVKNVATPTAGFVYFGQFIDHDITHDRTELEANPVEPKTVRNHRTVRFDLEHIYGQGPTLSPHLYVPGGNGRLLIGRTAESTLPSRPPGGPPITLRGDTPRDLFRVNGKPQIADRNDPRNYENLFVMQIHVLFMKFHNVAMDRCFDKAFEGLPLPTNRFERAQQLVRWHYQRLIHQDFLESLIDTDVFNDVLRQNGRTVPWHESGFFVPAEFSLAAFRFGHSMVRNQYMLNCHHGGEVPLVDLMMQSHKPEALPEHWLVEWGRLFKGIPELRSSGSVTPGESINTSLVLALHNLDDYTKRMFSAKSATDQPSELPVRTLLRGARAGLPTGQEVAKFLLDRKIIKQNDVLTDDELTSTVPATNDNATPILAKGWMRCHTPLYYYLLKEAEVRGKGGKLGPIGSRIVAEVFHSILREDQNSYLNKLTFNWALPSWTFPKGRPKLIDSVACIIKLVGDDLPQGCTAPLLNRLAAVGPGVLAQWGRFRSFLRAALLGRT